MNQVIIAKGKAQDVLEKIKQIAEKSPVQTIGELATSTLELQECPSCGVSWQAVDDMLSDRPESDNYQTALIIIGNCGDCKARFAEWQK